MEYPKLINFASSNPLYAPFHILKFNLIMDIQTDMTSFYEHKIQNEEGEMIIEWKMENGKWKNK